ncbi:MAG: hypothetical protein FJ091_14650 [Deltaproteobacteria bacterium]|nr:hypothetical protein [Deltaproteobacteria bacterium]
MLSRSCRIPALCLLLAVAPFAAVADGAGPIKRAHTSEAPQPRAAERTECVPSGPVGSVASVAGDARAVSPDGSSRALACDDVVSACDMIVTGADGSVGMLVDDAIVQVGANSAVQLSARPAPEVAVDRGAVRVVDVRDTAAQRVQLYTPQLAAGTGRGDAEITRDGDAVRVCAHDEPIVVMARDGAKTVPAGSCFAADGSSAVLGGLAGAPSVALGDGATCPFYVAGVPSVVPPVSSPPPGGPGIDPFDPPGRDSCDDPGSGCTAVCEICDDPDPGAGCGFPGSPCDD